MEPLKTAWTFRASVVIGSAFLMLVCGFSSERSFSSREACLRDLLKYTKEVFSIQKEDSFDPMSSELEDWSARIDSLSSVDIQLLCQMVPSLSKQEKINALGILSLSATKHDCKLRAVEAAAADQDPRFRISAANLLHLFGAQPKVLAAYTKLLVDPDPEVRRIARFHLELWAQDSPEAKNFLEQHKGEEGKRE
jgi:hypothetical protein